MSLNFGNCVWHGFGWQLQLGWCLQWLVWRNFGEKLDKIMANTVDSKWDTETLGDDSEISTLVLNIPCFKNISSDEIIDWLSCDKNVIGMKN